METKHHDLPARATNEQLPNLVTGDAWQKVLDYLQAITVRDDGGLTSQATETSNGIELSRV